MENKPVIVVTIPSFTVSIAPAGASFKDFEKTAADAGRAIGQAILVEMLKQADEWHRDNRAEGLENLGKRAKYLMTLVGDIRYHRRLYRREGKLVYLLDEKLGLKKNERVSDERGKAESVLAFTSSSYRKAQELSEEQFGKSHSHEGLRQAVISEGQAIKQQEDRLAKQIMADGIKQKAPGAQYPVAYVESDGTMIHLQNENTRLGEIKLGIGYHGFEPRYKSGCGKGKQLKDKFVYADVRNGRSFMENLSLFCEERLSLSRAEHLIVGGDGAGWVTINSEDCFPGAVYELSRYHLRKGLKTALGHNPALEQKVRELLNQDQFEKALTMINSEKRISRHKADELEDLRRYLFNNRNWINGVKHLKQRLPKEEKHLIGHTGAMEGNIDKVLANRFKKRGYRWSWRGCESLVKVGIRYLNGNTWPDQTPSAESAARPVISEITISKKDRPAYELPVLSGPHQGREWVKQLRHLIQGQIN